MIRSIFAVLLLITLVSVTSAGGGFKKKIFMKYAIGNLFQKCIGQDSFDKFVLEFIQAAKKCHSREFDANLKPLYIRPYPPPNNKVDEVKPSNNFHGHHMYNKQPVYQQQPHYQQPPQYQQQYQQPPQYRQPQYGYQQQFLAPQFGFQQPQHQANRFNSRQKRAAEPSVAGEAEMYFYNKLEKLMKGKIGNFTCMMQEMGYYTSDNEVNIEAYKAFYNELDVPAAMKEEFIEVVDLCQEISECIPERAFEKYPFGREYGRPILFSMCEKKKAVEVCLKKQMIDDYYKYKDLIGQDGDGMDDDMGSDDDLFSMGF